MAAIIDWPCSVVRPLNATYFLRSSTRTAGVSLAGVEQSIGTGMRRWEITLDLPRQFSGQQMREFEVLVAELYGRRNIAAVCICDPLRYREGYSVKQGDPWSDETYFTDGTGWSDPGDDGDLGLVVSLACAAGRTALSVDLRGSRPLRRGDFFSIDGFLYRVVSCTSGGYVRFQPEARAAIPAGAQIVTDHPVFYGRLADDGQGARSREYLKWGSQTSITFVEAFDR